MRFLAITLFVLVNAFLLNAKSLPTVENPCSVEGLYSLQFYYPYPNDDLRYIECDPWGRMSVKECPVGSKWNSWLSSCVMVAPEREQQIPVMSNDSLSASFCTYFGNWSCQHDGYCNQFLMESKCFCLADFSGPYCERAAPSQGAFGQIINETFSLDLYKRQRPLANDSLGFNTTIDTTMILDEVTKQRVQKYLNLYPNGEMRFDTLINYLVQDFLSQLYPSSFFLREFLLSSEIAMGYTNAIPNLLQSAKYAYDHFDQFFAIYVQVLDKLVDYLPKHMPKVKDEAQMFFEVYDMIFTRFSSMNNNFSRVANLSDEMENRTDLTRDEMRQNIYDDFNATLSIAYDLFRYLNVFDDELSVRGQNYTAEEMQYAIGNFSMDDETNRMLSELSVRGTYIWESLSFYGFWYVISSYVVPPSVNSTMKRPYLMDEKLVKPSFGALVSGDEGDDDQLRGDDERLVAESTTPFRLLVASSTVLPKVGALQADKELLNFQLKSAISNDLYVESTVVPRAGAQLSESTTVVPRVGSQLSESTVVPRAGSQLSESTVVPRAGAQLSESTTVVPRAGAQLSESTTVVPRAGAQLSESTVVPRVGSQLSESTTVVPRAGAQLSESTVVPRVGLQLSESTVVPEAGQWYGESSTAMPVVGAQLSESTTVVPRAGAQLSESTVVPVAGQWFGESSTAIPVVGAQLSESTVVPRAGAQLSESTVVPKVGAQLSESTVVPRVGAQLSESSTVMPRAGLLKALKNQKVAALMAESTTVLPRAGALTVDEDNEWVETQDN